MNLDSIVGPHYVSLYLTHMCDLTQFFIHWFSFILFIFIYLSDLVYEPFYRTMSDVV